MTSSIETTITALEEQITIIDSALEESDSEIVTHSLRKTRTDLEMSIIELRAEYDKELEYKIAEAAYESPMGQAINAVFWLIQYDYASIENYPGIVKAAAAKLRDLDVVGFVKVDGTISYL